MHKKQTLELFDEYDLNVDNKGICMDVGSMWSNHEKQYFARMAVLFFLKLYFICKGTMYNIKNTFLRMYIQPDLHSKQWELNEQAVALCPSPS